MKSIITDFIDIKVDLFVCLVNKNSIMPAFILLSPGESKCSSNLIVFLLVHLPSNLRLKKEKSITPLPNQMIMEHCWLRSVCLLLLLNVVDQGT